MKIAFLVWSFPVLSEPFILNQITGLIERGHQVDIYPCAVDCHSEKKPAKVHPSVEKYHLIERTYYPPSRPKNLLWRWLKAVGLLLNNLGRNTKFFWQLINILKYGTSLKLLYRAIPFSANKSYDIIHCQFGTLGPIALSLKEAGILNGKLITTFRGIDISSHVDKQGDRVYEDLFQQGNFFLANCDFFRQRAIKIGCDRMKIIVHGSGIDCSKFTFTPRYFPTDGTVRIATTGRLVEKKGIEYAIRGIAKLVKNNSNLEYNIIGDGILKEDLQTLIRELNLTHIVKLVGYKQQEEIIEILDKSHIFIAPSVTAADGNQDAPVNTLKEAMAMGLPVISTFHGGIPELVEDGISGLLVPERDENAIANKLNYLLEHPQIWPEMGKAGCARVKEKYDMNKLNDELVEIYQALLKGKLPQQEAPQLNLELQLVQPDLVKSYTSS